MTPRPGFLSGLCIFVLLAGSGGRGAGPAQGGSAPRPVEIRTSVSRTAVWVGDRITYQVELQTAPSYDILAEDLSRERLRVDGGELEAADAERREIDGGVLHTVRYTLTTYRVDVPELRVDAIPVRYYRQAAGEAAGAMSPAGEVMVPPLVVAIRSTLPASPAAIALRPAPAPLAASAFQRWAPSIGLGLVLLSIVPVAVWSLDLARRLRAARAVRGAFRAHRERRDSFDLIRSLEPDSGAGRVDACERLDSLIREHVRATTGIPAQALTPGELGRALSERNTRLPHHDVERLLAACERARYAPDPPSAEDWADAVLQAESILRTRRA